MAKHPGGSSHEMSSHKKDQAGGEGVEPSKSPGVRAAVKAAQPTIKANRATITKVQETALKNRQAKRKKRVMSDAEAKRSPKKTQPAANAAGRETPGQILKRRAKELEQLKRQLKG